MNIVIATGIYPPDIGGPATYSKSLAEEFSKRDHKVVVVTYGDKKTRISSTPYVLRVVSRSIPKGFRHVIYGWHVFWYGIFSDGIYAQDPISVGLPAYIASVILRKKFVLKVVGDYAWEQGVQRFGISDLLDTFLVKKYGARVEILRKIESFVARKAHNVIVPSKYLKSVVCRWGVKESSVTVVYNSIETKKVIYGKEQARKKLGITGLLLCSAGRLVPWKGFRMLIKLLPSLVAERSDLHFFIIGDGPERFLLETYTKELQMHKYVSFLGALSRDQLMEYIVASDIFLLNTGYEGFSHQILEVLALPVPLITTNVGGNKEIICDEENALVAEYNNEDMWKKQIMRLWEDLALYEALSRKEKYMGQYTKERMIQETLNVLI